MFFKLIVILVKIFIVLPDHGVIVPVINNGVSYSIRVTSKDKKKTMLMSQIKMVVPNVIFVFLSSLFLECNT